MESFPIYPKIISLGGKGTEEIFMDEIICEEKIDGSSVRLYNDNKILRIGSHKKELSLNIDIPDAKMFKPFLIWIKENENKLLELIPNKHILFGEMSQNQNILKYNQKHPIILFDIAKVTEFGLDFIDNYSVLVDYSKRLQIPVVPLLYKGRVTDKEELMELLNKESFLGNTKVEGVVVKNYARPNRFGRELFAKIVNEDFKEIHQKVWKGQKYKAIEEIIAEKYFTSARLQKAIQRAKEEGKYEGELRDLSYLIGDVIKDIREENGEDIKEEVFQVYWRIISRIISGRVPMEYKKFLEEKISEV